MHSFTIKAIALCSALLLGACATKAYPPAPRGAASSPESAMAANDAAAQSLNLRPGDRLEVRYYRNTEVETQRYLINVYDVLAVSVAEHDNLTTTGIVVLPDGHISLPVVGSVRAAGKSVDALGRDLASAYRSRGIRTSQVAVVVEQGDRRLERLMGLDSGFGNLPLSVVVSDSGMLSLPYIDPIMANRALVDVQTDVRSAYEREFGGRVEATVNLTERAIPLVYVVGEVVNPIGVEYTRPFNPFMAIAAAGGYLPTASPRDVRVIRFNNDGTHSHWRFNLRKSPDGGTPNGASFQLIPQDIVVVPPSGIAEANLWIEQYIKNMLPFSLNAGFGLTYDLND